MYEKILQKLKTQRGDKSSVSDRTLEDLAKSMESVLSTDEMLSKFDFSPALKSMEGNISHYTAAAVKEALEKKPDISKPAPPPPVNQTPSNDTPEWAKKLLEQNQQLEQRLSGIEVNKVKDARKEKLNGIIKDLPEFFTKPIVTGFDRLSFNTDAEFDEYLNSIKSSGEAFQQSAKESGLNITVPNMAKPPKQDDGQTDILREAREAAKKAAEATQPKK